MDELQRVLERQVRMLGLSLAINLALSYFSLQALRRQRDRGLQ
jgi:hypothetical protein